MRTTLRTINESTYLQLLQLRDELAAYRTVQCGMMHEQVLELQEETITDDADIEQLRAMRKGFCNAGMRRKLLGCAHSIANDAFVRLADKVYETGVLQTAISPSATIDALVVSIYKMDHEKGRMEKEKALAQFQQQAAQLADIENAIHELINRHHTAMEQLELVRHNIIQQVEAAIEDYQSDN